MVVSTLVTRAANPHVESRPVYHQRESHIEANLDQLLLAADTMHVLRLQGLPAQQPESSQPPHQNSAARPLAHHRQGIIGKPIITIALQNFPHQLLYCIHTQLQCSWQLADP